MTAKTTTRSKQSAVFTSWKLDILNAASADPRITATHFRMLVHVIARTWEDKCEAIISDEELADEVPGFKVQSTCYRARVELQALGYLNFVPGRGTRATRYKISDEPVKAIKSFIDAGRQRRKDQREARNGALRKRASNHAIMQGKDEIQPCKSLSSNHAAVQVVHPEDTPLATALRSQDMTQETATPACVDCGDVAEYEAVLEVNGPFQPYCQECHDDLLFYESRPILTGNSDPLEEAAAAYELARGGE